MRGYERKEMRNDVETKTNEVGGRRRKKKK